MSVEIRVPQLPESVADATLVAWRKQPGQSVSRDENLADLETDKVVLEVPASVSGVLQEIRVAAGTSVKSGELLAIIAPGAAAGAGAAASAGASAAATPAAAGSVPAPATGAAKLGPAAQRVAEELGLSNTTILAASKGGRASKSDLLAAGNGAAAQAKSATPKPASAAPKPALVRGARAEQRVPMTRLRQRIAERLVQAQSTQALLTTFNEVDLTHVNELRARYKEGFEKQHGVKLGFMAFFVKAAIEGPQALSGDERVGRRHRHRLSRVFRHRCCGLHRARLDGAGAAGCGCT